MAPQLHTLVSNEVQHLVSIDMGRGNWGSSTVAPRQVHCHRHRPHMHVYYLLSAL